MMRFGFCASALGVVILSAGCGSEESSPTSQTGGKGATAGGSSTGGTGTAGSGTGGTGTGTGGTSTGGTGTATGGTSAGGTGTGGTSGGTGTGGTGTGGTNGGTGGQSGSGGSTGGSGGTSGSGSLPEGDRGIAVDHPGDVGIESDSAVIFADGFETYSQASDLGQKWDSFYQNDEIRIATETANVFAGQKALEFTVPQQNNELSNATDKVLTEERDALFLRYYSKFQPPFNVVGSSHNGAGISAHYFNNGQATPGVPANGTNKFLVNLENWRGEAATPSPGDLNVYVYHPEQRSQWGDHFFPTGTVLPNSSQPGSFGPAFVSRPDIIPELDRWYCYELMVQANTPGQRDGRIAFWLDGKLAADFQNLRFRDVASLKIDRFGLSFHIGSNPNGETKKWFDNVVAATSYIGPTYMP